VRPVIVYVFDLTEQLFQLPQSQVHCAQGDKGGCDRQRLREEHPHRWLDRLRLREHHSTQHRMDRWSPDSASSPASGSIRVISEDEFFHFHSTPSRSEPAAAIVSTASAASSACRWSTSRSLYHLTVRMRGDQPDKANE